MKQPSANLSARASAIAILNEVITYGHSLNALLIKLNNNKNTGQHALVQELCYGVLRWYWQLDGVLRLLMKQPLKEKDSDLKILLLLGIYQLMYMRIAPHAAINETVNVTREIKKPWATKLVNGVLREFQRQQNNLAEKIQQAPLLCYSHPRWLLKLLQHAWPQQWEQIAAANNQRAPMTLRVNGLKQTREDYLQQLLQAEISAQPVADTTMGITLDKPCDVFQLPGFKEGYVSVQDMAGQLSAELLELETDQYVLDACAAPGGKTAHILETETDLAHLTILEIDPLRLKRIAENLQRLQLSNIKLTLHCADATKPDTWWKGQWFDRILLDAPCSGTGVIRRHPDIKLLRRAEDITALAQLQMELLKALWPLLKPGGILLYATCSILPQENSDVIKLFLENHHDAKEKIINAEWGIPVTVGRQLFPQPNGHDGFYYAKLIKME